MKNWTLLTILLILPLVFSGCAKKQYTLIIAANGQGMTAPSTGTYTYEDGKSLTITATPDSDWKFDGWSGDASGTNTRVSLRMDGNKSITANFSKITYILTMSVNGTGTTSPRAGARAYDAGTAVSITANPGAGWKFDGWSGDASGTNATVSLRMDGNKSITASFSKITYVLTIETNGTGTTYPPAGEHAYNAGTVVSITTNPGTGWKFDGWSGDASGTDTKVSLRMDGNKSITANFSKMIYVLTIETYGSGTTYPFPGTHTYAAGTVITITATPGAGWWFDHWSDGVAAPKSPTTTVTINSTMVVRANFLQLSQ